MLDVRSKLHPSREKIMGQDAIYSEAIERFGELFRRAADGPNHEPAAVTLATSDVDGHPSARVVLLRQFDERGFVFFTNSRSRKGQELEANPQAALCFYWDFLGDQIRIEGKSEQVADEESDEYWLQRPRESRIGAWASQQSERLNNRNTLDSEIELITEKYSNQEVPRPRHWYGYRVVPDRIEFWREGAHRVHTRTVYQHTSGNWEKFYLYP